MNSNELTKLETIALDLMPEIMRQLKIPGADKHNEFAAVAFLIARQFLDASPYKGLANLDASLRELDKHMIQQPAKDLAKEQQSKRGLCDTCGMPLPTPTVQIGDKRHHYVCAFPKEMREQLTGFGGIKEHCKCQLAYYSPESDNFYCCQCHHGMGNQFMVEHLNDRVAGKVVPIKYHPTIPEPVSPLVWQALEQVDEYLHDCRAGDCTNLTRLVSKALATKSSYVATGGVQEAVVGKIKLALSNYGIVEPDFRNANVRDILQSALKLCESSQVTKPSVPNEVVEALKDIKEEFRIFTLDGNLVIAANKIALKIESILRLCTTPYVDPRVKGLESSIYESDEKLKSATSYSIELEKSVLLIRAENEQYEDWIKTKDSKIKQLETQRDEAAKRIEIGQHFQALEILRGDKK